MHNFLFKVLLIFSLVRLIIAFGKVLAHLKSEKVQTFVLSLCAAVLPLKLQDSSLTWAREVYHIFRPPFF